MSRNVLWITLGSFPLKTLKLILASGFAVGWLFAEAPPAAAPAPGVPAPVAAAVPGVPAPAAPTAVVAAPASAVSGAPAPAAAAAPVAGAKPGAPAAPGAKGAVQAAAPTPAPTPRVLAPGEAPAAVGQTTTQAAIASEVEDNSAEGKKNSALKQAIREKLWRKLSVRYGRKGKVAILKPVNSSNYGFNEMILETLVQGMGKFGEFDLTVHEAKIDSLSLEEFRRALIRSQADVVFITAVKADQMNMFIYDRLTPYYIYAHTEALPDPGSFDINEGVITAHTKLLLRRTLFEFVEDQYYELPRGDTTPVLKSDVPRWVASAESLAFVNSELSSRFYLGVGLGSALIKGPFDKSFWNSNILSLQIGFRPYGNLYVEGAYEAFSYNAMLGSVKYTITTKNSPLKFSVGMGFARTNNKLALNSDDTMAFPSTSNFIVPSVAVLFPIVDVHFKIESRVYFGLSKGGAIFTLMPGIVANF